MGLIEAELVLVGSVLGFLGWQRTVRSHGRGLALAILRTLSPVAVLLSGLAMALSNLGS
jgi:hypothetical protein